MNIFDRAIAVISPSWAYKRAAWRRGMAVFDSGSVDRMSLNWNPQAGWNEQRVRMERELLRARAQDMERNGDIAQAVLKAFRRGVIGEGLVMQSKVDDEDTAKTIADLWTEWTNAENCDITATQDFTEILEMTLDRRIVDGGLFICRVYTDDKRFPFKIQMRTVDELETTLNTYNVETTKNEIIDGIEIDKNGRHTAYHFKKYKGSMRVEGESIRIEADKVIFWHHKIDPRQIREVSELSTVLKRIKDTNEFLEAVSIKERVLACLSVFIKKAVPSGMSGRLNQAFTPKENSYAGMSLEPGMIGELNPGDEVQTVIPSGQSSNVALHVQTMLRFIGAGVGLSYEAISRDLGNVTYSSARQGVVEDRKTYKRYKRSLINRVLRPIFFEFIKSQVLTGAIKLPPNMDIGAISKHSWIPAGSAWIDPTREVSANKVALETSQTTLARICAENGEDWREVIEQRVAERKLEQELMGGAEGAGKSNSHGAA